MPPLPGRRRSARLSGRADPAVLEDDLLVAQLADPRRREPALGEDAVGVLAPERRRVSHAWRHAGEPERGAHHRDLPEPRVRGPLDDSALEGLGIVHDLIHRVDRRGRHIRLLEQLEQLRSVVPADDFFQHALQLAPVRHPLLIDGEAWIRRQRVPAERPRELLPEAIVGGGDEDPLAVLAAEVAIRRQGGMRGSERLGHGAREQIALGVIGEQAQCGLEQRAVHALTEPRPLALKDRRADPERAQDAGGEIEERDGRAHRRPFRLPRDRHDAAEGLEQRLVAGAVLPRPRAAEGGDRAVDEARVDRREVVVAETEALHRARAEVLDEDVGAAGERLHDLRALRGLEIERHAALVAIEEQIGRRLAVLVGRPRPRLVAGAGVFHLDDVGAEIGKQGSAPGSRDDAGEIDHANAVEGQEEGCHARYYTPTERRLALWQFASPYFVARSPGTLNVQEVRLASLAPSRVQEYASRRGLPSVSSGSQLAAAPT